MNVDLVKAFQLADSVFPFENQVDPDPIKEGLDGLRIIEPIHYKGEIYKVEGSYLIQADIKYKYEAKCDRCYETTIKEVSTSLSGRLEDNESVFEEDEEDQDDIIYYEKGILNLDEYILMEVASSIPMKTLCDETCKGLCTVCGADLNKESCTCLDDYFDPRFELLKDFFPKE